MKILAVRHGETEENVRHICQGQTPGTLSAKGRAEAEALGIQLAKEPIACCYTSDQRRALDTANLILKSHEGEKLPLVLDKRLRERFFGSFEGKVFPPYSSEVIPMDEVETPEAIALRLRSFFSDIVPLHNAEDTIMIVSHGYTLRVLLAIFSGKSPSDLGAIPTPTNCSVTEIRI